MLKGGLYAHPFCRSEKCRTKDEDYGRGIFGFYGAYVPAGFTNSISDEPLTERQQSQLLLVCRRFPSPNP